MPLTTGGSDAGALLVPYYQVAERLFPILADQVQILPDTQVGTFGLAWYRGLDTKQTTDPSDDEPRFAVRDDIDINTAPYIGFHEAGHAFQETIARFIAIRRGISWLEAFDEIRERYWSFRGFPGTWFEAQLEAIRLNEWGRFPDESFADCFAHVILFLNPIPGYVTGEWTLNYGTQPIWQKQAQALAFMDELANEAQGEDMTPEQVIALIEEKWGLTNTISAVKEALSKGAHHTHDAVVTAVTTTSEPK